MTQIEQGVEGRGRLLLIGFDSPDFELLTAGVREGWLPTVRRLVEEGTFVRLDDMQDLLTNPMWPTLVTGHDVHSHGLVAHSVLQEGTYRYGPRAAEASLQPPFWRHFSDAGLQCTIASVYAAPLLENFRGTQLLGWGTSDPFSPGPRTDRPGLVAELEALVGKRDVRYGVDIPKNEAELRTWIGRSLHSAEQQGEALSHLAKRRDWDFFFGGFCEMHFAGHLAWHLDRPDHPLYERSDPALRGTNRRVAETVDAALAKVIAAADAETVMLVSPYVMGHYPHLDEIVDPVLEAAGLRESGQAGLAAAPRSVRALRLARRVVHGIVPERLRPALGRLVPRDRLVGAVALGDVDWSRTRAFGLPDDASSFVRINLAGREPNGIVQRGDDYARTCDEVAEVFRGLVDADTDEPVVNRVARSDELLGADPMFGLPDICINWKRLHPPRAVRLPNGKEVTLPMEKVTTGTHWSPGFLIGRGPGIPASGTSELEGPSAKVAEVAPTLLAKYGIDLPPTMRAKPIEPLGTPIRPSSG